MLIDIASRAAKVTKFRIIKGVFDNCYSKFTVDLKPLGPLAPLSEVDFWGHVGVVPALAVWARVINEVHKAVVGAGEVVVGGVEVVERDARL